MVRGLLTLLALSHAATAQCPLPDDLDGGPCCAPALLDLPAFPGFEQDSLALCWKDCDLESQLGVKVKWGTPNTGNGTAVCAPMVSHVRLFDASNAKIWHGHVRMTYSRTWYETPFSINDVQVWRFLVNGDLRATPAAGNPPCPVPSCAAAHFGRVKFTGYVDWALDCDNGQWSNAWMLTHGCDAFDHAPGFPRAGVFHPERSFSFVGPGATFAPAPNWGTAEYGSSRMGDVRRIRTASTNNAIGVPICEYEEPIQNWLVPLSSGCHCSAVGPAQWQVADLSIGGDCGTQINTVGGPYVPGFVSMGLGTWFDLGTYPGKEYLRWNVGGYVTYDPCLGEESNEVYYGVSTLVGFEGYEITSAGIGASLLPIYVDQVSSQRRSGGPQMNVPFVSNRVFSFNN